MARGKLITPLSRVRGLGSARAGTEHFWWQRMTAVSNIFLVTAFIIILVSLLGRNHAFVVQTLGSPLVAIVLLLVIASVTFHMRIGMQVIIEDYVHEGLLRIVLILANTFFCVAVALASAYALLKLPFGV